MEEDTGRTVEDDVKTINKALGELAEDVKEGEVPADSLIVLDPKKTKRWRPTFRHRLKRVRWWYIKIRNRWNRRLWDLLRWLRNPWKIEYQSDFERARALKKHSIERMSRAIGPPPTKAVLKRGRSASASIRKVRLHQLRGRHQAWKAVGAVRQLMTAFGFIIPPEAGNQDILQALWEFVEEVPRKRRAKLDAVATAEGIQDRLFRSLDARKAEG